MTSIQPSNGKPLCWVMLAHISYGLAILRLKSQQIIAENTAYVTVACLILILGFDMSKLSPLPLIPSVRPERPIRNPCFESKAFAALHVIRQFALPRASV